ncbi:uncharacterized protein [Aristolochia californica]|uniref:uncharacterized protein n=1 Tax=Aristolochia californica TaxID=171875 RepID=UPI0035D5FE12
MQRVLREKRKQRAQRIMDIFFIISKDERFSIEVGYFDTVLAIKEKIQKYQGVPVACQTLIFNGQVMSDQRDTKFYEVLKSRAPRNHPSPCRFKIRLSWSANVGCSNSRRSRLQRGCWGPGRRTVHRHLLLHLPYDGYYVIYKQNVMEDDQTFRWHVVRQGDTVEIFNGRVTGES